MHKSLEFKSLRSHCAKWIFLFLTAFFMVGLAASASEAKMLKIGMMDEPKTLNPFASKDIWAAKVLSFCYQRLYYRDFESGELVPWLAKDEPIWDPDTNTVTLHLRDAKWSDGTPFTAEDVVFTADVICKFKMPRLWNSWEFVKKTEAPDPQTVRLTLEQPMAILWERTLTSFIVQKSKWAALAEKAEKALEEGAKKAEAEGLEGTKALKAALAKPLEILTTYPNETPESLGPFAFAKWQRGSFIHLKANEHFFAKNGSIGGHEVGPYVDGLLLKIYKNTDTSILALKRGDIDYLWWGIESGYVDDLMKDPNIKIYSGLKGGYRYLAYNMKRPPVDDLAFRKALALLVDKEFIVKRILHDQGERLDTLVPPDNTLFFNPNTPKYGEGLGWKDRVATARDMLKEAGYTWDVEPVGGGVTGQFDPRGEGFKLPEGKPCDEMYLLTPPADYDAQRAQAGNLIQQWMNGFGIPVSWRPMAFGAMIKKVRADRDFDFFVSGWGALGMDPDYLRSFFHSSADRAKGKNSGGFRNEEFDRLADLQAETMDLKKRKELVFRLQDILMEELPYIPLYVPLNQEGVRSDRFDGWVKMVGGIGNMWSFLSIKPVK